MPAAGPPPLCFPRITVSSDGSSFGHTVRRGRRAGARTLVVHLQIDEPRRTAPTRVGFVVSKAVGNSVVRNRVKRRLRHLMADRLVRLPVGANVVVRALPPAAAADSAELARDLDRCLERVGAGVESGVAAQ